MKRVKKMKVRTDFVTNSSSVSYIISLDKLDKEQIIKIINHKNFCEPGERWHIDIDVDRDRLELYTSMDNWSIFDYLIDEVKIDEEDIEEGDW